MANQYVQLKDLGGNLIYPKTRKDMVEGLVAATQSADGLMSAADKMKLDTLSAGGGGGGDVYKVGDISSLSASTAMDKLVEIFGTPDKLKAAILAGQQVVSIWRSGTVSGIVSPCVSALSMAAGFVLTFYVKAKNITAAPVLKTFKLTGSGAAYRTIEEI